MLRIGETACAGMVCKTQCLKVCDTSDAEYVARYCGQGDEPVGPPWVGPPGRDGPRLRASWKEGHAMSRMGITSGAGMVWWGTQCLKVCDVSDAECLAR
jgi:hypothetical protein